MKNENALWSDRKRLVFFALPWTFTKYALTEEKLLTQSGILNTKEEEVRLYRIMDVTLRRSFGERIFGLGTVHCCSADKSTPEFDLKHIKDAGKVKDLLSDLVEKQRMEKRVSGREFLSDAEEETHFE